MDNKAKESTEPLIVALCKQAEELRGHSHGVLAKVKEVVKVHVGTSTASEAAPEDSKEPSDDAMSHLYDHLAVVHRNLVEIRGEIERL